MHIIKMDGKLKHEVQVEATTNYMQSLNVAFNHVSKTILVSLYSSEHNISLFIFSSTGELLYDFKIPAWYFHKLTSHINGPAALIDNEKVMMLQM